MGSFGGFYKGEKKKSKKGQVGKNASSAIYVLPLPEVISRKRKEK